jgi:anaphase-promoting complex subunit 8
LLNAIPETATEDDSLVLGSTSKYPTAVYTQNSDPDEALLEAKEINKYLLAKSLFDCREFDRCAAVFLPDALLSSLLDPKGETSTGTPKGKAKAKTSRGSAASSQGTELPKISQKSLFLALYAKFMSGEKRKNEDSEMVMGPQDLGTVINKQLLIVSRFLSAWFESHTTDDDEVIGSQGWLEYL